MVRALRGLFVALLLCFCAPSANAAEAHGSKDSARSKPTASDIKSAQSAQAELFAGYAAPEEMVTRARAVREKYAGSAAERDVELQLAVFLLATGKNQDAIAILGSLVDKAQPMLFNTAYLGFGGMSDEHWAIAGSLIAAKRENPDLIRDEAMLLLAQAYDAVKEDVKAWETRERLRRQYPDGDRVETDLNLVRSLQKAGKVPLQVRAPTEPVYDLLVRARRPHMRSLMAQYYIGAHRLKRPPDELASLAYDIVRIYAPLLSTAEVREYCTEGVKFAQAASTQNPQRAESMASIREFLESALDRADPDSPRESPRRKEGE